MTVYLFDTETTGTVAPEVIEAALIELNPDVSAMNHTLSTYEERFKPSKPIELGAMAVHHIVPEELAHCRHSADFALPESTTYIVGHNIDYDWSVVGQPDVKRICTLALARWVLPDIDSHGQSALYYHFFRSEAQAALKNAHSALTDTQNCLRILHEGLMPLIHQKHGQPVSSWDTLWEISETARLPSVMPFGKHRGVKVSELPIDYCQWVLKQDNFDPYIKQAIRARLNKKPA